MLLVSALACSSEAQQVSPLSMRAAEVKQKAGTLSPRAKISVIRVGADEEFGTFVSNDEEGFTFYDVDRKTEVKLKYGTVKKIKDGYGGYNSFVHRHVDRRKSWIAGTIVLGALAILIVAAARS